MKGLFAAIATIAVLAMPFPAGAFSGMEDGLVAYYPFDGNAQDASGYGNDGISYGPTLTEDREGKANSAYLFDGINDYVQVPYDASLDINHAITISAWVLMEDAGNELMRNQYIVFRDAPEAGYCRSYDFLLANADPLGLPFTHKSV